MTYIVYIRTSWGDEYLWSDLTNNDLSIGTKTGGKYCYYREAGLKVGHKFWLELQWVASLSAGPSDICVLLKLYQYNQEFCTRTINLVWKNVCPKHSNMKRYVVYTPADNVFTFDCVKLSSARSLNAYSNEINWIILHRQIKRLW